MKTLKLMLTKWEINQNGVLHSQVAWRGPLFLLGVSSFLIFPNFYFSSLTIPLTSSPHSLPSPEFIFSPSDPASNSDFFYNSSPGVCTVRKCPQPWICLFLSSGLRRLGNRQPVSQNQTRDGVRNTDGEFSFGKEGIMGIFLLDKLEGRNKWVHFCKERFGQGKRQVTIKDRVNEGLWGRGWSPSLQKSRSQGHPLLGRMESVGY